MTDDAAVEAARKIALRDLEMTCPGHHMSKDEEYAFEVGWEAALAVANQEQIFAQADSIASLSARLAAAEDRIKQAEASWHSLDAGWQERYDALTAERDRIAAETDGTMKTVSRTVASMADEIAHLKAAVEQARESARRQVESVLMLHYGAVHACAVEDLVEILGGNST